MRVFLARRIASHENAEELVTMVKSLGDVNGTEDSFKQLRDCIERQALVIADKYRLETNKKVRQKQKDLHIMQL